MIRAIIIDDMNAARSNIKMDLLNYCPEVEVIGEADGVVSGAKIIKQLNPDVIFLDIQMQDGSGFDLLEIIGNVNFKIIFTTASDEHAIRAFKFSAIDYLLKPIDPDELIDAVKKLKKSSILRQENIDILNEGIQPSKKLSRLALNTLDKIHIVDIQEIIRCESNVNYTVFYFKDKTKIMVTRTLKEYDEMLSPLGFIRIHQSHLINITMVKEYVKNDGGYVMLKDGSSVPVSSRKKQFVIESLSGN